MSELLSRQKSRKKRCHFRMAGVSELNSLRCGVCLEQYNVNSRVPKLLPCQHTFCQRCIEHEALLKDGKGRAGRGGEVYSQSHGYHYRAQSIPCPVCRKQHQVPSNGFTTNRSLNEILEELSVLPMETCESPSTSCTALLCDVHDDLECALFCMDCSQALCVRCLKGKMHNDHQLEEVADAKRMLKDKLDAKTKADHAAVTDQVEAMTHWFYSTSELEKAAAEMRKICDECEDTVKKWKQVEMNTMLQLIEAARGRDYAIATELTKLQSILDQSEMDIANMNAKLTDRQNPAYKISKLNGALRWKLDFKTNKQVLETALSLVFKKNATQEFLKTLELPESSALGGRKFNFRKAVHVLNALICEIDDDIIVYKLKEGKMEVYSKDSTAGSRSVYAHKLENLTSVHTMGCFKRHIDIVKRAYVEAYCHYATAHWDQLFV